MVTCMSGPLFGLQLGERAARAQARRRARMADAQSRGRGAGEFLFPEGDAGDRFHVVFDGPWRIGSLPAITPYRYCGGQQNPHQPGELELGSGSLPTLMEEFSCVRS
jgi:hypothetical protein